MSDYDFGRLTTRSFEHLVQAVALAVIGPLLTIFGDGPDGGREATFEGVINLTPSKSWFGYGVIQAKFKQMSGDNAKDGDWALGELKKEIEKYTTSGSKRRMPEFYIFATNVILTPVGKSGRKDKLLSMLEAWKKKGGPKDFLIWDYDQLATYLDIYESVRRQFAAWITPGDVLSAVLDWINHSKPDFRKIARLYLQKELIRDQFAKLEQAGHPQDDRIPLANVFVDLPVTFHSSHGYSERVKHGGGGDSSYFVERLLDECESPVPSTGGIPDQNETKQHARIVLIGGPGQGKTTVGQYLCQLYRVSLLSVMEPAFLDPDVLKTCSAISSGIASSKLKLPGCRRFPIRIVLSDYAARLSHEPDLSLLSFIADLFTARTEYTLNGQDVRDFLAKYPFILVLDGLDEVPASSNRDRLLQMLRDFEIDARSERMDGFVLVTTRPQGYNEDLSPSHYSHRNLVPLSSEQSLEYGDKLIRVRFGSDPDRVERVSTRLHRASMGEATKRLMRSPLQITIMVLLVDQYGHAPEERWHLFHEYYRLLCRREVERDIAPSRVIREYGSDIDTVHRLVGLVLQAHSEISGGTQSKLSVAEFEQIVKLHLVNEGYTGGQLANLVSEIVEAAANRLVFLVGLEDEAVAFEIRSLQEFMAGEAILHARDDVVQERLRLIAPNENWRNVFLFAVGKCFKERQHLRSVVADICASLNDDPDDEPLRRSYAGSRLAIDLLRDGAAKKVPRYANILMRTASQMMFSDFYDEAIELADVCSEGTASILVEAIDRAFLIDPFSYSAWCCITRLLDHGYVSIEKWRSHADRMLKTPEAVTESFFGLHVLNSSDSAVINAVTAAIPYQGPDVLRQFDAYLRRSLDGPPYPFMEAIESWHPNFRRYIDVKSRLRQANPLSLDSPIDNGTFLVSPLRNEQSFNAGDMPDCPEGCGKAWQFVVSMLGFGANPSHLTLSQALAAAARLEFDQVYDLVSDYEQIPWPLLGAIGITQSSGDLDLLGAAAKSGDLGTMDTWISREQAWTGEQIVFDANQLDGHRSRLEAMVALFQSDFLLFFTSRRTLRTSNFDLDSANHSARILKRLSKQVNIPVLQAYIYRRAMMPFRAFLNSDTPVRMDDAIVDVLIASTLNHAKTIQNVGAEYFLSAAQIGRFDFGDRAIDILDKLSRRAGFELGLNRRRSLDVRPLLATSPGRTGLLLLIASEASGDSKFAPFDAQMFFDTADEEDYDDLHRAACAVIDCRVNGLVSDDGYAQIVKYSNIFGYSFFVSVIAALERKLESSELELVLVRLLDQPEATQSWWKFEIFSSLKATIDERQSGLAQPRIWANLQFPQGLLNILQWE